MNHFSGESIRIEVEYEPSQVTNAILYDFASSSVKVRKQANGSCRAVFSKMNSVTLIGWFMQYANMFQVIEPLNLRNELREQLKEAVKNYE